MSPVLPDTLTAAQNFALTRAFLNATSSASTNAGIKRLLWNLKDLDTLRSGTQSATMVAGSEWTGQTWAPLDDYLGWVAPTVTLRSKATCKEFAAALLANLQPQDEAMRSLAAGARLAYFQPVVNGDVA